MERVWAILMLILYVKGRLEDRVNSFDVCLILFAKLGKIPRKFLVKTIPYRFSVLYTFISMSKAVSFSHEQWCTQALRLRN